MSENSKLILENLNEFINPYPTWEDPEYEYSETNAKLALGGDRVMEGNASSSILKLSQNALLNVDDRKYIGEKVSRKSYEKGSTSASKISFAVTSAPKSVAQSYSDTSSSDDHSDESVSDDEELDSELPSSSRGKDGCVKDSSILVPFECVEGSKFYSELEKANAVRNQIRLWDDFLEVRIQLQKCLVASNKLPPYHSIEAFKRLAGNEFQTQLTVIKEEGLKLLNNLLELQTKLLSLNSETKNILCGRLRKEENEKFMSDVKCSHLPNNNEKNESQVSKLKRKLCDISADLTNQDVNFKRYRDNTLQKWYLCSKVATVKSSNFSAFDMSVLKQIEHILRDKENLVKRTQRRRSSYQTFGVHPVVEAEKEKVNVEFDSEIYDDDDFYHKLLRELIERRSTDLTDPSQLSRQWSELQKLRRRLKKNVDTKASKGRKIRYVVHSKLVNFMAAVPYAQNDSTMDDLFRSLFGRVI